MDWASLVSEKIDFNVGIVLYFRFFFTFCHAISIFHTSGFQKWWAAVLSVWCTFHRGCTGYRLPGGRRWVRFDFWRNDKHAILISDHMFYDFSMFVCRANFDKHSNKTGPCVSDFTLTIIAWPCSARLRATCKDKFFRLRISYIFVFNRVFCFYYTFLIQSFSNRDYNSTSFKILT